MRDGLHDDFVALAAATLPGVEQPRALRALVRFSAELARMTEATARGVRVAPAWRDPERALRVEAERREALADVSAVVFVASAESWALRGACRRLEYPGA